MSFLALLKLWFRCLPQPLIPDTVLPEMTQIQKCTPDQKIQALRQNVIGKISGKYMLHVFQFKIVIINLNFYSYKL